MENAHSNGLIGGTNRIKKWIIVFQSVFLQSSRYFSNLPGLAKPVKPLCFPAKQTGRGNTSITVPPKRVRGKTEWNPIPFWQGWGKAGNGLTHPSRRRRQVLSVCVGLLPSHFESVASLCGFCTGWFGEVPHPWRTKK
jgi:hypothetical protein